MTIALERRIGLETQVIVIVSIFFFQAEDGIRDRNVTGVQTCALPIYSGRLLRSIVEQKTKLRCVQARCTAGGRARSKRSNRAMRTAMRGRLVAGTADAHGHARPDIIAERDGAKKVSPADAELLRSSECSGQNRSAGTRATRSVR